MSVPSTPDYGSTATAAVLFDPTTGTAPKPLQILLNATATGAGVPNVPQGSYIWAITASNWNGATATLQVLGPDGTSWLDVTTATSNVQKGVALGSNATVRVAITVAVPAGVNSTLS